MSDDVSVESIEQASHTLEGVAKKTPLELCKRLSDMYGANIYFKREDLQAVRSFKIRGAYNKMSLLTPEEKSHGVVCASAGNHAQGVAYGCATLKIKGVIFMPTVTPNQKIEKVKKFGGDYVEVKLIGNNFDEASAEAKKYCDDNKMSFVHAFNDPAVIAGQGTVGKEIYEQLTGKVDYVFIAVGGGGLISGVSTFMKAKNSNIKVVGVESTTQASMYESLKNNAISTLQKIDTFIDGTAVKTPGQFTFDIVKEKVDEIVLGYDGQVATDMIDLYQNEGIIVEPAGALALSGLIVKADEIRGKNVVCIICGGNNDILRYPEVLERSLVYKGLKHYFIVNFAQKPGQLRKFLNEALGPNDDIVRFEYIKKNNKEKGPAFVGLELTKREDLDPLLERMKNIGMTFELITSDNMLYDYLV